MTNKDFTELFIGDDLVHRLQSSHRLLVGDLINIAKVVYKVTAVNFALDHSGDQWATTMVQAARIVRMK